MKHKWLTIGLIGISSILFTGDMTYGNVMDRPTLFLEILKQNEQLSRSAVTLMTLYLDEPEPKDVDELKCLFRKMIGDNERRYLAANGFSVDDFIGSLDAIAKMPEGHRRVLLEALDKNGYSEALTHMAKYDNTLVIGREQIPLSDGNGNPITPVNAKVDFERMLKNAYEQNKGTAETDHWSMRHGKWLIEQKGLDEAILLKNSPSERISYDAFVSLLNECLKVSVSSTSKMKAQSITRMEAMQLIFNTLKLDGEEEALLKNCAFTDIQSLSAGNQYCIRVLTAKRLVAGYANGELKPNQLLTYGEAWALIRKALE